MSITTLFWFWVVVLGAALFLPVSNLMHVFSVRRLQKKLQRELDANEIAAQKKRSYFIAIFVCLIFSILFNYQFIS